jgi:hypothetical protein
MDKVEQLVHDNLRLLNALKVSLDIISGDFHLYDEGISAKELIKQIEEK